MKAILPSAVVGSSGLLSVLFKVIPEWERLSSGDALLKGLTASEKVDVTSLPERGLQIFELAG